ncbi:MAG: endonuclease III domain-containing protein [Firmicutes bacterium]|nr:endonuclease III domain-containing protein [Bacillota bacterium]
MARFSLEEVFARLLDRYGPQHWWPAETPFEIVVGAILTQATSWRNVEKAIGRMKEAGLLEPARVLVVPVAELEEAIRPAGYFRAKACTLKRFCTLLNDRYGGDLARMLAAPAATLRRELLRVRGVGPETADSILLYAGGYPVFVIDAYTRRIFSRTGLIGPPSDRYDDWQAEFHRNLPPDPELFGEYHALLVALAKDCCRKRRPQCGRCPLQDGCRAARDPEYLDRN